MSDSQKFIARNRAPRVQIEYDVELYGAEKKVQLPFVMGVISDLSGKAEKPPVADRQFLDIDVDNFDDRMRAMAPRASFTVPNTLTGDGNLAVDLTFEKMSDFSPEAIAAKVDTLAPLLEARTQLSNLMAYMDGKAGAESLIETLLNQPALLQALSSGTTDKAGMDAALDSLRANLPDPEPEDTSTDDALESLAAQAQTDTPAGPTHDDILGTLDAPVEGPSDETSVDDVLNRIEAAPEPTAEETSVDDVLGRIDAVETPAPQDESADILAGIERREDEAPEDTTDDILASLDPAPTDDTPDTALEDALASIDTAEVKPAEADTSANVLDDLKTNAPDDTVVPDQTEDILASIEAVAPAEADGPDLHDVLDTVEAAPEDNDPDTSLDDILSGVEAAPEAEDTAPSLDTVLGGIEAPETAEDIDDLDDILSSVEAAPVTEDEAPDLDEILSGVDAATEHEVTEPDIEAVLNGIETPDAAETTDDLDAILSSVEAVPMAEDTSPGLDDILSGVEAAPEAEDTDPDLEAVLEGIETPDTAEAADDLDDILGSVEAAPLPEDDAPDLDEIFERIEATAEEEPTDELDDILAGLETSEADEPEGDTSDLDAILGGLDTVEDEPQTEDSADDILASLEPVPTEAEEDTTLDDILSDLEAPEERKEESSVDDILGELEAAPLAEEKEDDLDALLADLTTSDSDEDGDDDLESLLADLEPSEEDEDAPEEETDDLDALLNDLEDADEGSDVADDDDDLDALLSELSEDAPEDTNDDLDTLLSDIDAPDAVEPQAQLPYGTLTLNRPDRTDMNRRKFRMALFGDFTGRAARGILDTGDTLAEKTGTLLDVDTVEDIIESFATTLTLPIGKDGAGIEVTLNELDDLHPDELYEKVEIFEAISSLRQQLGVGSMAGQVTEQLKSWSETFGTPVTVPSRSAATSVPPNLKLSDFQALIGDTSGALTQATPADELIARVVGPYIVKAPDAGAAEMLEAVDQALSGAMRLVLHHPDFQAVESQWRSLDLMARRIETDETLEIVLFDVSAEELAADLAAQEDLSESGLFRLLTQALDPEEGAGGFSALLGLYTFEETPPHAELLGRIAKVAAHVDAPFFAAMTPGYLETAKEDRHTLVAKAWDTLRGQPEASYLGLASPRFLLRLPYGAKTEPCYEFDFEEFTPQEGLSGMLWANPVVLIAILMAGSYKQNGKAMNLGSLLSLGDLPFHYVTDRHGDQVALPCTDRNLTSDPAQATLARGFMPVAWMKGRNEVRLGSFRSLGGDEIAGPWSDIAAVSETTPPAATLEMDITIEDEGDDALDQDDEQSLEDLLAGFDEPDDDTDDDADDEIDAELAALLEGL